MVRDKASSKSFLNMQTYGSDTFIISMISVYCIFFCAIIVLQSTYFVSYQCLGDFILESSGRTHRSSLVPAKFSW